MFDSVKKLTLAAGVSLIALTAAASAQEALKISKIDVEASYSAAQDSNAASFYPDIAIDLRTAIAERVPTSDDAGDPTISVDVRKISLDGATMLPETQEFNELEGVVSIESGTGDIGGLAFPVNIKAVSGDMAAPEGYIVMPPSDGDFYVAMVNFFADRVAEELAGMNTSGDGVSK